MFYLYYFNFFPGFSLNFWEIEKSQFLDELFFYKMIH